MKLNSLLPTFILKIYLKILRLLLEDNYWDR